MDNFLTYDFKFISKKFYVLLVIFTLLVSFSLRFQNLNLPLLNSHYFRQTQTATVARNFYKYGIDVFNTKLDIFGEGKERTLLIEFPLFQAIVSGIAFIFGFSDWLGRIVSLIIGLFGGAVLQLLAKQLSGSRWIGLFSLIFFLFMPLNIFFQQAFMIEATVVTLHIFSIYSWVKFASQGKNRWYLVAIISTTLAFLQKNIYSIILLPVILSIIISKFNKIGKKPYSYIVGLGISIFVLMIWQHYVDRTNLANGNSFFTSTNINQWLWNFGNLNERLKYSEWLLRIDNIIKSISKFSLIAFILGLYALFSFRKKINIIIMTWLASALFYLLLFFRVQVQVYYLMIILPAMAIISGYGLLLCSYILSKLVKKKESLKFLPVIVISVFLLSFGFKSWRDSEPYFLIDQNMYGDLVTLKRIMQKKGYVVFVLEQRDWNSVYTYYTNKTGVVSLPEELTPYRGDYFRKSGYAYLVLFNLPQYLLNNSLVFNLRNKLQLVYNQNNLTVYQF